MATLNDVFMGQLPQTLPLFPLTGALLLPRGTMPLNIFEPRYLEMLDYARAHQGVIGMIQPHVSPIEATEGDDNLGTATRGRPLYKTGCVGMITEQAQGPDNSVLIVLTGLSRFDVVKEVTVDTSFRLAEVDYSRFSGDCMGGHDDKRLDRSRLMSVLEVFLEQSGLRADWKGLDDAGDEELLNVVAMVSPLSPAEKQMVIEAPVLEERFSLLMKIMELTIAGQHYHDQTTPPVH